MNKKSQDQHPASSLLENLEKNLPQNSVLKIVQTSRKIKLKNVHRKSLSTLQISGSCTALPSIAAQGTSLRREGGSRFRTRSERTEVTPGSNPSYTFTAGESAVHRQPHPPRLLECQLPGAVREGQPRPPHHVLAPHLVLCTLHHHLLIQNQLHCQHYAGDIIEKAKQMTTATLCQVFLQKRGDLMSHLNQLIENSTHDLKKLPEVLD